MGDFELLETEVPGERKPSSTNNKTLLLCKGL